MDFFSDTQEIASRFSDDIFDLHDVFRCNGIDFGSPEDFFAFARTLKYHSDLRGDVLRVVKSVMESETNVSFRTILTVIAVASGGPDIGSSEREMSAPVKLVIESLIGVGACGKLDADHPEGLYPDLTVKERALEVGDRSSLGAEATGDAGEAITNVGVNEPLPIPALAGCLLSGVEAAVCADVSEQTGVEGIFMGSATGDSQEDSQIDSRIEEGLRSPSNGFNGMSSDHQGPLQGLVNDFGGSNTLAESLTRLELNSLQLKIYLDSIDQRISRMEPRLENVPSIVPAAPQHHPRDESGARFSATIPSETEPEPLQSDPPVSDQRRVEDRSAAGLTGMFTGRLTKIRQVYSSPRQVVFPILAGVATLVLAASLFWRFGSDPGYAVVHPLNASAENAANAIGPSPAPMAASSVSDRSAGTGSGSQVPTVSKASAAPVRGAQGDGSALADRPIQSPKKSGELSFRPPSSSAANAETRPVIATDTSEVAAAPDRTYNLSSEPVSKHLVKVSSGVMAANLVSGPKPSYPALASLMRTQGNVVMQAVISKTGTVEHLRVIKGHRLLRGAAKNAVRMWRYRPYKIGGVPVEVATIVSVDFSLNR